MAIIGFLTPALTTLGLGGILGYVTGVFVKQATKWVAFGLGMLFVLLQLLAFYGMADVHWQAVGKHALPAAESVGAFFWKIVRYNLPFTGGFGAGFYLAMRR